ncbi:MAG: hypothetical protein EU530_09025, partial [Promethearchaeota archaeon]
MQIRNRNIRIVVFLIAIIVNIPLFWFSSSFIRSQYHNFDFKVAMAPGPQTIEPLNARDLDSINTIKQVCEGLYMCNYSSSEMEPLPCLASVMGTWDVTLTNLTIPLKTDITFHNGEKFNASAVK